MATTARFALGSSPHLTSTIVHRECVRERRDHIQAIVWKENAAKFDSAIYVQIHIIVLKTITLNMWRNMSRRWEILFIYNVPINKMLSLSLGAIESVF